MSTNEDLSVRIVEERGGRRARVMMLVLAIATMPSVAVATSPVPSSQPVVPAEPPAPAEPVIPPVPAEPGGEQVVPPAPAPAPAEPTGSTTAPSPSEPAPTAEDMGWGPEPAPTAPVMPAPAPAPAPIVVVPPPPDPELQQRRKTASGLAIGGAVLLGTGGAAWLFLSIPAALAASAATDRAQSDPFLVSESELYARAERRRRFAAISFFAGLGGVVAGGTMLGVGLGTKSKIEREMTQPRATVGLQPMLSRQSTGATVVLRY